MSYKKVYLINLGLSSDYKKSKIIRNLIEKATEIVTLGYNNKTSVNETLDEAESNLVVSSLNLEEQNELEELIKGVSNNEWWWIKRINKKQYD